jgi:hypothetical protein
MNKAAYLQCMYVRHTHVGNASTLSQLNCHTMCLPGATDSWHAVSCQRHLARGLANECHWIHVYDQWSCLLTVCKENSTVC